MNPAKQSKHKEFKPKEMHALKEQTWGVKDFDDEIVTIHSWNVNGFRAVNKKDEFANFLKKGRKRAN